MPNKSLLTSAITIIALLALSISLAAAVEIRDLRCDAQVNPLGVDNPNPRFSWILDSGRQTAFQVVVGDVWDSGKVVSDASTGIDYAGKPLEPLKCYELKVRVWDAAGNPSEWSKPASFTTALRDCKAEWIAAPADFDPVGEVTVQQAAYRAVGSKESTDVTAAVQKLLADGKREFVVDSKVLGVEPSPGSPKELEVKYVKNHQEFTVKAADSQICKFGGDSPSAAPWFRKEFDLSASPEQAFVTVHSPGYFELYVNGNKVGDDVLSPAVSRLNGQSFTLTYDVARYLHPGKNCIGLWLGKGWARSATVRAQLDAVVAGKPLTIGTDTTWMTRRSGLYRIGGWKWDNFGGEQFNAREYLPDWSQPGIDLKSWTQAIPAPKPSVPGQRPGDLVRSQPCPTNRIGKRIPAVSVTDLKNGLYEIDFGTCLTGWLNMKMPALPAGTKVTLSFADATCAQAKRGKVPYQTFNQVSEFVSGGKTGEIFQHKFNYAGFRYVIVEGLPSAPAKEDAVAMLVESDLEKAGDFECSNDLFNRIHRVNEWTLRCLNLGGYSVDCPHRERLGYGGDGQMSVEGVLSNFRVDRFYRKWLADWRARQEPNGKMPNVAPQEGGGGGPPWGGFLTAVTWRHYLYYGDRRVLEENYDAACRYADYLESRCKDDVLRKFSPATFDFLGDWVAPNVGMGGKDEKDANAKRELFNNCYRLYHLELLEKIAAALGKTDDAARFNQRLSEIRPKVHAAFYNPDRQEYVVDEQAYYMMPLMTGVVPENLRPVILKKLEDNILIKNKGHLDTGMVGTYFLMEYLRQIGRNDLVFTMYNQTTFPSWGNMLAEGATTFWELWTGYWSHIHACFTSADNWLYQGLAGILPDPTGPGFKKIIIRPTVVGNVTWVNSWHDSPYGRIVSNWKRDGNQITLDVTIPANTTATVYVSPKEAPREVGPGKHQFTGIL